MMVESQVDLFHAKCYIRAYSYLCLTMKSYVEYMRELGCVFWEWEISWKEEKDQIGEITLEKEREKRMKERTYLKEGLISHLHFEQSRHTLLMINLFTSLQLYLDSILV